MVINWPIESLFFYTFQCLPIIVFEISSFEVIIFGSRIPKTNGYCFESTKTSGLKKIFFLVKLSLLVIFREGGEIGL